MRLLRWFCREDLLEDVEGDLLELYASRMEPRQGNKGMVNLYFALEVLRLIRPGMIRKVKTQNNTNMYSNYLLVAIRNAMHYKGYTVLNLLGLIIGITTSMLIYLWIENETSIDQFHKHKDRLFAVKRNMQQAEGNIITTNSIPHPLKNVLEQEYPEVEAICEVSWLNQSIIGKHGVSTQERGRFATENFFEVFSWELIHGDKTTALKDPSSIVISETLANKLIGEEYENIASLMGETIEYDKQAELIITGIFKDLGEMSHDQFDWLIPAQGYIARNDWMQSWENGAFSILVLLKNANDKAVVADRIYPEIEKHTERTTGETLWLQKFSDMYLYDKYENGTVAGGRITYVRIMQVVALFILLIACINFMNLATARSSRRTKEIGIRKVMGAHRGMVSWQFLVEALLYATVSVFISLVLVYMLLPLFNQLVGKQLILNLLNLKYPIMIIGLIIGLGLFAGSYPALKLSSLTLTQALRGTSNRDKSGYLIRKGLVVFQVAISFILLFGALIISNQLDYMLTKDTGINRENIVSVWMEGGLDKQFETYRQELLAIPGITGVTGASGNPISYGRSTSTAKWEGQPPNTPYELNVLNVYDDYFENMGLSILQGRAFDPNLQSDSMHYMINESAAAIMGFDDPIGKGLSVWGMQGRIIGVVEDYNMRSLHNEISPLIILNDPSSIDMALISIDGTISEVMKSIEEITVNMSPGYPFQYQFLDESYQRQYETEITLSKLSSVFVIISVIIAVLGLFGLSSYSAELRSKEIGVRKVHGASTAQLLLLLSRDYAFLIGLAFLLAAPLGYYLLRDWLNYFAYHIDLGVGLFFKAGVLLFVISMVTVLFKSYQAASTNPVRTLRSE